MNLIKAITTLLFATLASLGCNDFKNVPPSDIGMVLTSTGYEDHVYTPGQVDIKKQDSDNQGSQLVLIQRSGVEVKESFSRANTDKEDHRIFLHGQESVTLDVRLLLALPDYEKPDGRKDLAKLFMLGNPKPVQGETRVLRISADEVYAAQAQQVIRGRIRQICTEYKDFDAIFAASQDNTEKGLMRRVEGAVADVLKEKKVPLALVNAFPSNLKPDQTIIDAISAKHAADINMQTISSLSSFLDEDKTGSRRLIYQTQALRDLVASANGSGQNTVVFAPTGNGSTPMLVPITRSGPSPAPAPTPTETPKK